MVSLAGQQGAEAPGPGQARIRLGGLPGLSSDRTVAAIYAITLLLVCFGLIMVLSSSSISSYTENQGFFGGFLRQATFALIGLPLMLLAAAMPVSFWKKWAWALLGLGIALQLLVFTPLGVNDGGNRNWIRIGSIGAQPSEALKLALIVWIGAVLLKKEPLLGEVKHELIPVIVPGAITALGLVLLGRDLGTTIIMAALVMGAMYFGGVSWKSLGIVALSGLVMVAFFVLTSQNRMRRILGHASSTSDYSGVDWQSLHGKWALAGGGLFGVGLGGSKAKWSWLPAADNDFIFAIIGEELGMIGAALVILLFVTLAVLLLRVIARAPDRFGKAVVGGIFVWIIGQAFINIAVVVGILPVLGVPLPLISAGGTALVSCLAAIGVVISVARDAADRERGAA